MTSTPHRPLCDRVTLRLQDLARNARFWRPTVKFLLKGTCLCSLFTGLIFFFMVSYVMLQRVTFKNMITPLILLVGMEMAADMADTNITQMISKPTAPCDVFYNLCLASLLVMFEILLWHSVLKFYHETTQDLNEGRNIRK